MISNFIFEITKITQLKRKLSNYGPANTITPKINTGQWDKQTSVQGNNGISEQGNKYPTGNGIDAS